MILKSSELEERMDECPVCCSPYLKPKLLPCLDTICFACLDEYVIKHEKDGTFSCPVCHTLLAVPQGGITLFDDNLHIKGDQSLVSWSDKQLCEVCDEKIEAVKRCIECEQNFCKPCSKQHLRLNIAKNHTLVEIVGPDGKRYLTSTAYCDKHRNEELTFYCRTCYQPICLRCRLTTHEDHTSEDINDFADVTRKELRILLDEGKEFRFALMKEIETSKNYGDNLQAKKKYTSEAISERRARFHKAVDKIYNDIQERLERESTLESERIEQDQEDLEKDLTTISTRIATANQIIDFGSDIDIVRKRQDIVGSLWLLKKEIPLNLPAPKLEIDFSCQEQAEISLRYLFGRLTTDLLPPSYIDVLEVSSFRVADSADVINSICPTPDGKCWVICGWRGEISLFDRYGQVSRTKRVGNDVDCLAIDADGNSYVSCRDEHAVKRFNRNFKRRMATLNINYPRGIATTSNNKLVICVNETPTYFDYSYQHVNKVLKLGPDGDESKELKNPSLKFMYPIRVAVNLKDNLCVSDNIQHAVLFLKPNGELKSVYNAQKRETDIALVKSGTPRKAITGTNLQHHTSTPIPRSARSTRTKSRKRDCPASAPTSRSESLLDRTKTPPNSPKTEATNNKALAPLNLTFDGSTTGSSISLESPRKKSGKKWKAIATFTDGMESASVTEIGTEYMYTNRMTPFDPRGITCDKYGHVIVADYNSNLVHLLDKHGRFLMYLLTEVDGIFAPTSVAIDKAGFLWVGGGDATIKIYRYISDEVACLF